MSLKTKTDGLAACLRFSNPLQLVFARLLFRKSRFVPHTLGGVQFVADQFGGDECGLRPCLVEGMYDPFLAAAGIFTASSPLDIVDLGANAGGFSLIFAARRLAVRKILAVEMNPLTYSRMRLNLLTNFGPAAIPLNAAVSGQNSSIRVPFSFGGTGEGIKSETFGNGAYFDVPMLTLDRLMDSEFQGSLLDLLKMDIEGSEYSVLQDLLKKGPFPIQIAVEFHHRFEEIGIQKSRLAHQALARHGYRLAHISPWAEEFLYIWQGLPSP